LLKDCGGPGLERVALGPVRVNGKEKLAFSSDFLAHFSSFPLWSFLRTFFGFPKFKFFGRRNFERVRRGRESFCLKVPLAPSSLSTEEIHFNRYK